MPETGRSYFSELSQHKPKHERWRVSCKFDILSGEVSQRWYGVNLKPRISGTRSQGGGYDKIGIGTLDSYYRAIRAHSC